MARLARLRPAPLALLMVGALAAAGCAEPEPLPAEWKGRDLREPGWANATLAPGWTLALEYVWQSGRTVEWDWFTDAAAPLHFQVVRMEGGQPRPLVGHFRAEDRGSLTVPVGGAHQVLFENVGAGAAGLWHHLPEGAMPRMHPPGQGPGCLALAC